MHTEKKFPAQIYAMRFMHFKPFIRARDRRQSSTASREKRCRSFERPRKTSGQWIPDKLNVVSIGCASGAKLQPILFAEASYVKARRSVSLSLSLSFFLSFYMHAVAVYRCIAILN